MYEEDFRVPHLTGQKSNYDAPENTNELPVSKLTKSCVAMDKKSFSCETAQQEIHLTV